MEPGGTRGYRPAGNRRSGALVRLAAQEGRDLELIVFHRVMHRRRPAVLVEPLRRRTLDDRALGVIRDRVRTVRLAARAAALAAPSASAALPVGRGRRWRGGRTSILLAPAEADRGEALQATTGAASPGQRRFRACRARIWFCAGIGSSSIRGMRGARTAGRSACGGMNGFSGAAGGGAASICSSAIRSTNSVGFGVIGRIVTSSIAVIGAAPARRFERRLEFGLRLFGRSAAGAIASACATARCPCSMVRSAMRCVEARRLCVSSASREAAATACGAGIGAHGLQC